MTMKDNKPLLLISELSERFQKDNLYYMYRGRFTQRIIVDILELIEKNLLGDQCISKVKKKIYNMLVEGLQNITRHQATAPSAKYKDTSMMAMQATEDRFLVTTANLIENKNIPAIRERIDYINSLSAKEIKKYYKEVLVQGAISEKGGAGLGFIDMARKSGSPLLAIFTPVTEDVSYFYFRIEVPNISGQGDNFVTAQRPGELEKIHRLHLLANQEKITLIYNHILNLERKDNLLSHLKEQLSETTEEKRLVYDITFDMLNTLVKYTLNLSSLEEEHPIIFFLKEGRGSTWLNAGSFLLTSSKGQYTERLEGIRRLIKTAEGNGAIKAQDKKKLTHVRHLDYTYNDYPNNISFLCVRVGI